MDLPRSLSGRTPLVVIFIGFALSLALIFYFSLKNITKRVPAPIVEQEKVTSDLPAEPVRLKIPVINVDAAIEYVGLIADGSMGIPKGLDNVAWYELGPRPGEDGSAVMAGHYGTWKNGQGSVFDNLNKLNQGDKLYIEDDRGATVSFIVRESRRYNPSADAKEVFSSNDEKAHLNLITCEGTWNKDSKSYSQRLVVFTDKEGD